MIRTEGQTRHRRPYAVVTGSLIRPLGFQVSLSLRNGHSVASYTLHGSTSGDILDQDGDAQARDAGA